MNNVEDINYGLKIIEKGRRPELYDINYGLKIIAKGRKKKGWMGLPRKVRRNISFSIMGIIFVMLLFGVMKGITNYKEAKLEEALNSFEYIDIYVKEGDTAYELQEKLAPNKDVRKLLYYASYKNEGKNLAYIQEGEFITLIKE